MAVLASRNVAALPGPQTRNAAVRKPLRDIVTHGFTFRGEQLEKQHGIQQERELLVPQVNG